MGVDFFFVLSGFLIALSAYDKTFADYSWHRFRRVILPYWPIGLGTALLYTMLPHVSAGHRDWNWLATLTLSPFGAPALSVAWTLQHEVVFYAVFAVAWFSMRMWVLAIWGGLCVFGIGLIPFQPINLEFLAGVLCFYATRAGVGSRWLLLAATLPLSVWILLGAGREASTLVGIAIAIALPCAIRAERRELRVPAVLVFLGEASYSIYLGHGLAISVAARFSANMWWCFCAGTVGGLIYYVVVERNMLSVVGRQFPITASKLHNA